jgi:hypothetical protein
MKFFFLELFGAGECVAFSLEHASQAGGGFVEDANKLAGWSLKQTEQLRTEDVLAWQVGELGNLRSTECRIVENPGADCWLFELGCEGFENLGSGTDVGFASDHCGLARKRVGQLRHLEFRCSDAKKGIPHNAHAGAGVSETDAEIFKMRHLHAGEVNDE